MAIIKFGPTVVGARGLIAGTIFSANKAGPFARGWSKGSNPRSTLQSDHRGRFTALAAAWRDLTQPQRDDWIDYADDPPQELTNSLGETYFASGFNWYLRINLNLELASEARRVDAPTLVQPLGPSIRNVSTFLRTTAGGGTTLIKMDAGSPNLGLNHVVFARLAGQGRTAIVAGFTFQRLQVPNGFREIPFQAEIEASFGTIALLQRGFFTITTQDSHGQRGPIDSVFKDATT